jgi:outer membrane protein assembly factor BamA
MIIFPNDTFPKKEFKSLDIFPAISYAPETSLTLGAIGIHYWDFAKGDLSTPLSSMEFIGVYTLKKQIIIESRWEFFGPASKWRTRGEAFFNRYPDRNYGIGNSASAMVMEVDEGGVQDTLNFLNFDSDRIKFSPVVLRKIGKNLYLGLQYDMEYLYRMKITPMDYKYLNPEAERIDDLPVEGFRSGIGLQVLLDNRDFILNPLQGTLAELNVINYNGLIGSDYSFTMVQLDARHYINTIKNQVLALRTVGSFEFTNEIIPMRALSRVGGHDFMRGYFKGTYQDHHLAALELEYRLPLWKENTNAPLWKVWKRAGFVGFIGAAQVFRDTEDFHLDEFNLAAGAGLRILFNTQSRVCLRIDYAIGLSKGSNGFDDRQSGFYFYLGEAF